MKNFIDTNLALGYALTCDKWHDESMKFFEKNQDIIWSNKVKEEFNDKFKQIFGEINEFMLKISSLLNANEKTFINIESFERYILSHTKTCTIDKTKKIKIIEFIWNNSNIDYNTSPLELIVRYNTFMANYNFKHDNNKNKLEKTIDFHNCGLNNYKKYSDLKDMLEDIGVHNPDYIIILDAHDLGLNHDVSFNTTDKILHEIIKDCDFLMIKSFNLYN